MAITIKIDQDPDDPRIIEALIEPPERGTPNDEYLMQLAFMVISELRHQLMHDPETCPECQAEAIEDAPKNDLH